MDVEDDDEEEEDEAVVMIEEDPMLKRFGNSITVISQQILNCSFI